MYGTPSSQLSVVHTLCVTDNIVVPHQMSGHNMSTSLLLNKNQQPILDTNMTSVSNIVFEMSQLMPACQMGAHCTVLLYSHFNRIHTSTIGDSNLPLSCHVGVTFEFISDELCYKRPDDVCFHHSEFNHYICCNLLLRNVDLNIDIHSGALLNSCLVDTTPG